MVDCRGSRNRQLGSLHHSVTGRLLPVERPAPQVRVRNLVAARASIWIRLGICPEGVGADPLRHPLGQLGSRIDTNSVGAGIHPVLRAVFRVGP